MLSGTEKNNLVYSCSRGSLKLLAEFCFEEKTTVLSIKKFFRQFIVSKNQEILSRICSNGCFVIILYQACLERKETKGLKQVQYF